MQKKFIIFNLFLSISNLLGISYIIVNTHQIPKDNKVETIDTVTDSGVVNIKRATVYNAVVEQCNSDPFTTADGSKIDKVKLESGDLRWIALSQDLIDDAYKARVHPGLFKGEFKFGDTLRVESKTHSSMNGLWVVRDCMNRRYKNSMDFLLPLKGKRILGRDFKISKKY